MTILPIVCNLTSLSLPHSVSEMQHTMSFYLQSFIISPLPLFLAHIIVTGLHASAFAPCFPFFNTGSIERKSDHVNILFKTFQWLYFLPKVLLWPTRSYSWPWEFHAFIASNPSSTPHPTYPPWPLNILDVLLPGILCFYCFHPNCPSSRLLWSSFLPSLQVLTQTLLSLDILSEISNFFTLTPPICLLSFIFLLSLYC